ncbi:MAG: hypothetical protein WDW38_008548 [Sanguina aurantia]
MGKVFGAKGKSVDAAGEDVYYCSLEYGPEDVRTSLGYYNMGKVFGAKLEQDKASSCDDQVVRIWSNALCMVVLGLGPDRMPMSEPSQLPVGRLQLMEVVDMLLDIGRSRKAMLGPFHPAVSDAHRSDW